MDLTDGFDRDTSDLENLTDEDFQKAVTDEYDSLDDVKMGCLGPTRSNKGCLAILALLAGSTAVGGVIAFGVLDGDDDDGRNADGQEVTVDADADDAGDDGSTADDSVDDDTAEADDAIEDAVDQLKSMTFDITASTGETFTTTFHPAPTNTDKVLVAAPSRNVDEDSLDPLAQELQSRDCASVPTFNARPLEQTFPFDACMAVIEALEEIYGFLNPSIGTLGASFTGLDAVSAAEFSPAMYALAMSPSQENPLPPPDDVMVQLIGASGDLGFVDIYNQWADLGYDAFEFDSDKHGTAMFQNGVSDQVVNQIADTFCG